MYSKIENCGFTKLSSHRNDNPLYGIINNDVFSATLSGF